MVLLAIIGHAPQQFNSLLAQVQEVSVLAVEFQSFLFTLLI